MGKTIKNTRALAKKQLRQQAGALRRATINAAVQPLVESLEGRRLLSVGSVNFGPLNANVRGFQFDYRNGITTQADGKILVAGYVDNTNAPSASGKDVAIARYNTNGVIDSSFGVGGVATLVMAGDQEGKALAVDSSGRPVVAVTAFNGSVNGFAAARFTSAGVADSSFDGDGYTSVNFNGGSENAWAIAVRPDGRVVVGGTAQINSTPSARYDFAIAQFNTAGALDTSFDGDGKFTHNAVAGNSDQVTDLAIQPDGKIVAAGTSNATTLSDGNKFIVARYNATGGTDGTFGSGGVNVTIFGAGTSAGASGIALQADGKIVAAGTVTSGGGAEDIAVARYSTAGVLDNSFDGDGKATLNYGATDRSGAIAVQTIGGTQKIVVSASTGSNGNIAVARLNLNGSLDNTFDGDGKVTTSVVGGVERVPGLAIQTLAGPYHSNIITAGVNTFDDLLLASYDGSDAPATFYDVYANDNWSITTDVGPAGYSFGDTLYDAPTGIITIAGVDGFNTIQGGVTAVAVGGNVHVLNGTYTENVTIGKDVNLLGQTVGGVTLRPAASGNTVGISTGFSGDVVIDNINFDGSTAANDYGIRVDSTAAFANLTVTDGSFSGFDFNAIAVFGNATTGISVQDVDLTNLSFSGNGSSGGGGSGDLQFFEYNGAASLINIDIVGTATASTGQRIGIQFRGVGGATGTGVQPIGAVTLNDVDVSGDFRTQMIGFQRYQNAAGLSLTDVKLGGATSKITGSFGASLRFDAVGFGSILAPATLSLGNTTFRGLAGASAQRHELEFAPDNSHTFLRTDGTGTTWKVGGIDVAAGSLTVAQAFDVERRILHYSDKLNPTHALTFGAYKGFVDIQANKAFVTDDTDSGLVGENSITRAVEAVAAGGTVHVDAGTYDQNVSVGKSVTLLAESGSAATTINGVSGAGALGAIVITPGVNNVKLGQTGKGFTVNGIDNGSPGIENAAVYLQGAHSNVEIVANKIVAAGDLGLLTEFGQNINNLLVTGNEFAGVTFLGGTPADNGFANQFTTPNVPRQLVTMSPSASSTITFTNNLISGTAGGTNGGGEQGNTLVTIDASNSTISGNTFTGTTTRFGHSLRARGTNTQVTGNTIGGTAPYGLWIGGSGNIVTGNTINGTHSQAQLHLDTAGHTVTGNTLSGAQPTDTRRVEWVSGYTPAGQYASNTLPTAVFVQDASSNYLSAIWANIQGGVNAAPVGGTVTAQAGNYVERVNINKTLLVQGSGVAGSTISGTIGGSGSSTVVIGASNVELRNFKITREGNNMTDWNNAGLVTAGVSIQGLAITGANIHDNFITNLRTGIDINNSGGHSVHNNQINDNRTGLIFRNQTDNISFTENEVKNNTTVGILFLDASGGSNSPVQQAAGSTFFNNDISGNWYGQIVDRQAGGSLPAPGTNGKNFSGNWFGTNAPVVSTANSTEPGYAAQIPSWAGGSAVAPGGQPDVLGPASANFDITPYLGLGTDISATYGFQGDFSNLHVVSTGTQTGSAGRIQEAVDLATAGGTVTVHDGTYVENVTLNKSLTLRSDTGKTNTTITGISGAGALGTVQVTPGVNNVKVGQAAKGFTINGIDNGNPGIENAAVYFQGAHSGVEVVGNNIVAAGDLGLLTEFGQNIGNMLVDSNEFSGVTFLGGTPADNGFANQFTTPNVPRQLVVMSPSASSTVTFTNNVISGTAGGTNGGGEQGNTLVTIDASNSNLSNNTFTGTTTRFGHSLRARGTNVTISSNSFGGTAPYSLWIGGSGNTATGNTFNGVNSQAQLHLDTAGHTVSGNTFNGQQPTNTRRIEGLGYSPVALHAANTFQTAVTVRDSSSVYLPAIWANIQGGVNAASAGHIVEAKAGTYVENVTINKTLEVYGAGEGATTVVPSFVGANTGGGSLSAGHSSVFLISANNVELHDLTVDGDNTALAGGINVNGANVDARNGIITDHTAGVFNGLDVHDVTVNNIYLRGIYASSGGSFHFDDVTVDNVAGEAASIAIFNFGGSGIIENSTVTRANDAIATNHSTGTQILNNTISQSASGIHSDNGGDGGGTPDVISGNTITNGGAGSYGIFVFVPYNAVTVSNNTVSGVEVGLAAFGGQGGSATFTNNSVDLNDAANSVGAYVGTDTFGFGDMNVTATFTDNTITNAATGFGSDRGGSATATVSLNSNDITNGGAAFDVNGLTTLTYNENTVSGNTSGGDISNVTDINWTEGSGNDTFDITATTVGSTNTQTATYGNWATLVLATGAGNDTVNVTSTGALTTWVDTGADTDAVHWASGAAADNVVFSTAPITSGPGATESVYMADNSQTVNIKGSESRSISTNGGNDTVTYVKYVDSVATGFTINGGDNNDTLGGGLGDDTILGGNGADRLDGSNGNDSLKGEAGNDSVYGGIGNDILEGGAGVNQMYGQNGNDTIYSQNSGLDFVDGGAGFDSAQVDGIDLLSSIENFLP